MDFFLREVVRAAGRFVRILVIAAVDYSAIFVGGVPDFYAEEPAAVLTDQLRRQNGGGAVRFARFLSAGDLLLHNIPISRNDDRCVTVLNVILRKLPVVFLDFF